MEIQRLDKIISSQLVISRKDARIGIRRGFCKVDGQVVRDAGFLIDAQKSKITYLEQIVSYKKFIYIMMNKPKGVLSASNDKKRQTVVDLVPDKLKRAGLFPVGRLDRDTTGLLIITDDGEFAHNAISPKKNIFKTYIATLDGAVNKEMVEAFERGIVLADGTVCKKAYLKPLDKNRATIKISEGKYHQIKRMFGVVGVGVNELTRVAFGGLKLPDGLAEGKCCELTEDEKNAVFKEY